MKKLFLSFILLVVGCAKKDLDSDVKSEAPKAKQEKKAAPLTSQVVSTKMSTSELESEKTKFLGEVPNKAVPLVVADTVSAFQESESEKTKFLNEVPNRTIPLVADTADTVSAFQESESEKTKFLDEVPNRAVPLVADTATVRKSTPIANEEVFDFCAFPESLKLAVREIINKNDCHLITTKDLSQVKKLTITNMREEETKLLNKGYASYFSALEDLNMSNNPKVFFLPSFVTHLRSLKTLNISQTGISDFNEDICKLDKLEVLRASHNKYVNQEIPIETFCLSSLKVLDISHSCIRYIDEYIGKLSSLEEFYVSDNSLFLIPHMLTTLPSLTLLDLRNNPLANEDLNYFFQNCKGLTKNEKEECQEDLLDSIRCESIHEIPFQRGEPLRQMYVNLAAQSPDLMKQCKEDKGKYCPSFLTKCEGDSPEYNKEQCMLDNFESTKAEYKHKVHRDKCYINWASWFVDYEKFPELLNKTIRGKTIREIRYVSENKSHWACWEWPWENIRTLGGLIDFAPKRYSANLFEVFPKNFREPGVSSRVKSLLETEFWWIPEDCPHLPSNLKDEIEKIASENEVVKEGRKK